MTATLTLSRRAIGAEVRRGPYEVLIDEESAGSIEMHVTIEFPVQAGRHILQIRESRNSSRVEHFDVADNRVAANRCTGKRFLPLFLLSFAVPSLGLVLRGEQQ